MFLSICILLFVLHPLNGFFLLSVCFLFLFYTLLMFLFAYILLFGFQPFNVFFSFACSYLVVNFFNELDFHWHFA
jgi:hypothetical protein